MSVEKCLLCDQLDSVLNLQKVSEKGARTLNEAISKRKDYLELVLVGQFVHRDCRKNYSSERKILQTLNNSQFSSQNRIPTTSTSQVTSKQGTTFC